MPIDISTLPTIRLDYTAGGTGLQPGMRAIETLLAESREGYMLLDVVVDGGTLPVIMARSDLYIVGFQAGTTWWRFSDADWPFRTPATSLGHDGQYTTLGGLQGSIDIGAIASISVLCDSSDRQQWRPALRTLLVVVAECARLIPVRMRVLGLLNGIFYILPLGDVQRYIKNWSKASKGHDMSEQAAENLRVGFKDPTIIRR